jgi:hypothetical protein
MEQLTSLVEKIRKGECILFLGAGVHVGPAQGGQHVYADEERPALGRELAEKLAAECDYAGQYPNDSIYDLQRVALCVEKTRGLGRKTLVDLLTKHLSQGKKPSTALNMLAEMPFKMIVTTNYDRLLELALYSAGKDPFLTIYEPESERPTPVLQSDPTEERPLIFKMHGDLDRRDSIVITDEDYITFVQRMSEKDQLHPVPYPIRFRMMQWPTLFVGYSLRDYNLRLLFRTLRWRVDPANFPISYSVDVNPDPLILRVWQDERGFITFVIQDVWTFVPWLYEEIKRDKQNAQSKSKSIG